MADTHFDPKTERYMIDHMNQEHSASVYWYAKVYGNLWDAEEACMIAIDKEGMDLDVETPHGAQRIRIPFDHRLADDDDAQHTLVEMSIKAREIIMSQRKQHQAE